MKLTSPLLSKNFHTFSLLTSPFRLGDTLPHPGKPPTVTHILIFQTACKVTSQQCHLAQGLSEKINIHATQLLEFTTLVKCLNDIYQFTFSPLFLLAVNTINVEKIGINAKYIKKQNSRKLLPNFVQRTFSHNRCNPCFQYFILK